jgi:hypothetical protein
VQELQHTNASLVGHTNIKQKIKQHEKLKDEVSHCYSAIDVVVLLQNISAHRSLLLPSVYLLMCIPSLYSFQLCDAVVMLGKEIQSNRLTSVVVICACAMYRVNACKQIIDLQRMNKELTEEAFRLRKQLGNSNNNSSNSGHSSTAAVAAAATTTGGHHTSHSSGTLTRKGSSAANTTAAATASHGCTAASEDEHVNNENATK